VIKSNRDGVSRFTGQEAWNASYHVPLHPWQFTNP
jgi:hypothetical protein